MLLIFNSPSQVTQCVIRSDPAPLFLNNSKFWGEPFISETIFPSISTILDFFAWEEKKSQQQTLIVFKSPLKVNQSMLPDPRANNF